MHISRNSEVAPPQKIRPLPKLGSGGQSRGSKLKI